MFLLFICLALLSIQTSSASTVQSDPSEIQPQNGVLQNSSLPWISYPSSFNGENFSLQFPVQPTVFQDRTSMTLAAADLSMFPVTLYQLGCQKRSRGMDAATIFENRLALFAEGLESLCAFQISSTKEGHVLDLLSMHSKTYVFRKERILVTRYYTYSFDTFFFAASAESHTYFIESFVKF